jgi:hypothetical protein
MPFSEIIPYKNKRNLSNGSNSVPSLTDGQTRPRHKAFCFILFKECLIMTGYREIFPKRLRSFHQREVRPSTSHLTVSPYFHVAGFSVSAWYPSQITIHNIYTQPAGVQWIDSRHISLWLLPFPICALPYIPLQSPGHLSVYKPGHVIPCPGNLTEERPV